MIGRVRPAVGGLVAILTVAASAEPLTLREAAAQALAKNPAIAAADARRSAATAREREARAARLPRLELTESATRGNNPVFVFGSLLEQGDFAPRHFDPAFLNAPDAMTNFRAALTARYPLFDRLRASTDIRHSRNAVDRASVELEETRQRLRAETIARFYGVLVAEQQLAVAAEAVRAAEADAKKTRDRFAAGLLVESDALSADVQLASFRQKRIAAEGDLAVARTALATLLQSPVHALTGELPAGRDAQPLESAVANATAKRAAVLLATSGIADAQLHLLTERASALPRVDAFGTFGASGRTFADRNTDHTAAIAITLDLFDRGRSARVAAARADIDAAKAAERMARDTVTMEVTAAWHRLRTARESAAVAATAVAHADAAARIVRDRYENGLTTITEQLHAQTALLSARFELLAARYESVVAQAELLRATGDLDEIDPFL